MGTKRESDKPNKKDFIIGLFLVLLCLTALAISLNGLGLFNDDTPLGYGCFYENAIIKEQYIDTTLSKHGGDCSEGCLFMDVYSEDISFLKCGHVERLVST